MQMKNIWNQKLGYFSLGKALKFLQIWDQQLFYPRWILFVMLKESNDIFFSLLLFQWCFKYITLFAYLGNKGFTFL